jgi:hypothetical protein
MINKITKKVVKEVEQVVSEEFVCDVCGKKGNYRSETCGSRYESAIYYRVTTGHYDWGNDSCDSIENKDACCTDCLLRIFSEWLNDKDVKCSNSAYIHIDKEYHTREKKGGTE